MTEHIKMLSYIIFGEVSQSTLNSSLKYDCIDFVDFVEKKSVAKNCGPFISL